MKYHLKFSTIIVIFSIYSLSSEGQCIADAGADKVLCVGWNSIDTISIGGHPAVRNGTPPYIYKWEASYTVGAFNHTAADFLNDTTIANPSVIDFGPGELTFYLTVLDSLNKACTDSVKVQFAQFGQTLDDKQRTITQGDSVQLYPSIGGGIPPVTYRWTPNYKLSDPNIAKPWASPDTTIKYLVSIRDSAGCKATDQDFFEVFVNPLGINEYKQIVEAEISPNPLSNRSILSIPAANRQDFKIVFYDTFGRKVQQFQIKAVETEILKSDFKTGLYFYRLYDKKNLVGQDKLVVH